MQSGRAARQPITGCYSGSGWCLAAARPVSLLIQDVHLVAGQISWLWLAADKANSVAALRKAGGFDA